MLTLTENASTIVRDLTTQPGAAAEAGLRITSEGAPEAAFAVAAADRPETDDQVVQQDGATVYLDSDAAALLDDKVLDAGVSSEGNVEFSLAQQP